jgi:acyl-CoA dehydrogenase
MANQLNSTDFQQLKQRISDFIDSEIIPNEMSWLRSPFAEIEPILRDFKQKLKEIGGWNLYQSTENGGQNLSLPEIAQLCEVLGRSPFGHFAFNCQAPDAGNIELLTKYARPEIRKNYLEPLLNGQIRSCFGMTEPENAGSNPTQLSTIAHRVGEFYEINGHKWFTSSADGATFCIVMAVTNPDETNPYKRASMLVVPTQSAGFQQVRNLEVLGHAGSSWDSHAEILLKNVRIPIENRLGGEGDGFQLAQERLGPGRIHHCMRWIGICERAFELMCRRAATRSVGGGQFLGEKQMIQDMIATSRAEIDAARLMVLACAAKMESEGHRAAAQEISTIKFFTANILWQVVDRAIQIHGALGLTEDSLLGIYFREARAARIYDGADEVHKASLARSILKKYGLKSTVSS